jgi:hypothetical protein
MSDTLAGKNGKPIGGQLEVVRLDSESRGTPDASPALHSTRLSNLCSDFAIDDLDPQTVTFNINHHTGNSLHNLPGWREMT